MSTKTAKTTELRQTTRRDGDALVVELEGQLAFREHQSFKSLIELIEKSDAERVRLDLKKLGRADVTTLGLLMVLHDTVVKKGMELQFVNASRAMAEISKLSVTGRKLDLGSAA